ncbi:hypothetical protein [Ferroglobus placidus]|uniref:hypothetical protein n=1 Tax=Ferroglobus placidus TaxID=54261 RepID=UPI00145C76D4|nr:hypothetical protein [Ferroglobus placidus]
MRALLKEVKSIRHPCNLKMKAEILMAATSRMHSEEVYRLKLENIDCNNCTVLIPAD